jgi:transposase InsO family protein
MPWKELSPVEARVSFIEDHATKLFTMTELCDKYGISRTTGYKWLGRAKAGESLADRSRRPHHSPHQTPAMLEEAIVATRIKRPSWGPDKLLDVLQRQQPDQAWPSRTTVGTILTRHDLVKPRSRRRDHGQGVPRARLLDPLEPNEVWSTDFKGEFRLGHGAYCYPLTVCDSYSRYLLGCQGLSSTAGDLARPVFDRIFREYGLPRVMLSDNGSPFAGSRSLARLSRLSVWWMRLGIWPVTIDPGKPQQNGRHERMHRTLKAETTRPPASNMDGQQARFDGFGQIYNHERPHAALDMRMPAEVYQRSPRPMPAKLEDPDYPGHYETRRVRTSGCIKWRGALLFVSEALTGELLGLEEIDEDVWSVWLDRFLIARLNDRTGELVGSRTAWRWPAPLALRAPVAGQHQESECQPCRW